MFFFYWDISENRPVSFPQDLTEELLLLFLADWTVSQDVILLSTVLIRALACHFLDCYASKMVRDLAILQPAWMDMAGS